MMDPVPDTSAIYFKLGLSRSPAADAPHQPGHLGARATQSRQHILQLCKLYLDFPFSALSSLGENIEDQLSAVDDFQVGGLVDRPNLSRSEVVIEDDYVRAKLKAPDEQLIELSAAQ